MLKIEINDRFGKLVVNRIWSKKYPTHKSKEKVCDCLCDCGSTVTIKLSAIRYDNKRCCGCDDRRGNRGLCKVGERFGKLTVLKTWTEKYEHHKSKEKVCECLCDCGETVITRGRYLRSKHKQSCGCWQRRANKDHHAWKGHEEISGQIWNEIQNGAIRKSKTIPFNLTVEEIWNLYLKQERKCALSGVEIGFSYKNRRYGCEDSTASLDRIDSSKGYTLDNVQWVHKHINIMKWNLEQADFIEWCQKVSNHNRG